jgi:RNA polymerase sigma-70 factor, ECF subfamily
VRIQRCFRWETIAPGDVFFDSGNIHQRRVLLFIALSSKKTRFSQTPLPNQFVMNQEESGIDFSQEALRHLDALYGFALALTHDRTEAEDLVQETYLRAARAFGRLLPDSNLKSWLFAIMRNIWRNQLRHRHSGPQFVEMDAEETNRIEWLDHTAPDPHAVLIEKVERAQVRDAIASLPTHYREVIVLRDLEGFSYQQIATILHCPAGTVMSRLGRARAQLRVLLLRWQSGAAGDKELGGVKAR